MAEHSRPGKGVNSKVRLLNGVSNGFDTAAYRQSSGQYETEAESDIYDCFVWQEVFIELCVDCCSTAVLVVGLYLLN